MSKRPAPDAGQSSDAPANPLALARRASASIRDSMVQSRRTPLAALSAAQERDLRSFYIELMERRQRDGWAMVEETLAQIAVEMKGGGQQQQKRRRQTEVPLTFDHSK